MEIELNALSSREINKLIRQLKRLDKNLVDKANHRIYKICDSLADETQMEYGSIRDNELDGNVNDDIRVIANENYGESVNIEAIGSDLYFIEFGTGTMLDQHPSLEWLNIVGWTYGGGSQVKYDEYLGVDYWWYDYSVKFGGDKSKFKRSVGMNSYPYMFYCSEKLKSKLSDKSSFKGLLREVLQED